eukprot:3198382-Amphidinium_carterae.1
MPVEARVAGQYRLPSASVVRTGPVPDTWSFRPAWPEFTPCALRTQELPLTDWRTDWTSYALPAASTRKTGGPTCLDSGHQLECAWDTGKWAGYRSHAESGRLKHQGPPSVVSTLEDGVVLSPLFSSSMMSLLCRKPLCYVNRCQVLNTPLTDLDTTLPSTQPGKLMGDPVEDWLSSVDMRSLSKEWRKARIGTLADGPTIFCPLKGGLHIFNVYGYSSDKERAQELNREVCMEIFAAVAALGNRQIFILGDWNFEPDNFSIDLLNGGQVNRPLSEVLITPPTGGLQIDWILCSKALMPACGKEVEAGTKPDHVAISLDFRLELVSQGYRGQKSYETAERTKAQEVENEYARARRGHLASWSTALAARDVDALWELWCRASEQALGLPPNSRGRLLLGNQQLLEKVPDEEAIATAKQQDTVANLKVKLLDTGACTFFEWPAFLGVIPPTAEGQLTAIDEWVNSRKKRLQAERTANWRAYVKEM